VSAAAVLSLRGVRLVRDDTQILTDIDWSVAPGERWVVLGPNGAGKTTLLQIVTAYTHPTAGAVSILGDQLGHVDVRRLRRRIAVASGALTRTIDVRLTAREIVSTGRSASLAPWWDDDAGDASIAAEVDGLLAAAGLTDAADRPFSALSEGERQRTLLARMRLARADLWVFDEPAAGLDLGARERLVADLAALARAEEAPAIVFVTHHLEEIPPGFTHALLLRGGRIVGAGPLHDTLSARALSETFGLPLDVSCVDGRWAARGRPAP